MSIELTKNQERLLLVLAEDGSPGNEAELTLDGIAAKMGRDVSKQQVQQDLSALEAAGLITQG